jgi:uncharacterized RDD family membrane protein YckC
MQNPPPLPGYQPAPMAYSAPAASYGGFWIRAVAFIIDAIILGIVAGILAAIFHVNIQDPGSSSYQGGGGLSLLIQLVYFAGLWTYMGASIGQRIFGLRVVDANTGQPIGLGKAALRWLGMYVSFIVCLIGVIWVAFDGRKQGWMDKIAGTVVLHH